MQRLGWAFGGVVLALLLSVPLGADAWGGSSRAVDDDDPAITSVVLIADQTILVVTGRNFSRRAVVVLGDYVLGGVQISSDGTSLTALMPAVTAGTYRLRIGRPDSDSYRTPGRIDLDHAGSADVT